MNLFFSFQDTYNNCLKERYKDGLLIHPDLNLNLWLEAGLSGRPDRNQVYGLSNTIVENLQMTHSFLSIRCSQSIPSTQTLNFKAMWDQGVHDRTTHLNEKYEQFTADYEELCRVVMEMRSHMDGPCDPPYWPHGLGDDQPPLPPLAPPLF
jgi:hypothetical protein